tara:strand:+ start:1415 stop:1546 length:132 start_codon:yes stop_codon:yes gene_type:complete
VGRVLVQKHLKSVREHLWASQSIRQKKAPMKGLISKERVDLTI